MIVVSENMGEFINIDKFEPNPFLRKTNYPLVSQIKIDTIKYKDENNKIHIKKVTTKRYSGNRNVIKRRLNMKKFGDALNSNDDGITTVGEEVKIEMVNCKNIDKPLIENIDCFNNQTEEKKYYKPTKFSIDNTKNSETKNVEYKVLLRNIPTDYSIKEMSNIIKDNLNDFGLIKSIRLMKDKYNSLLIRDIAFVEFFYKKDMDNLLNSGKRIIIDNSIIDFEKMHTENQDRRKQ